MHLQGIGELQDLEDDIIPLSDEDSDEEDNFFQPTYEELFNGKPESLVLHLPSTLGYNECVHLKLHRYVKKEISLQEGQANDALHGLRCGTHLSVYLTQYTWNR